MVEPLRIGSDEDAPTLRLHPIEDDSRGLRRAGRGLFTEAAQQFSEVVENHPATEAAPEALYWAGVTQYKSLNDPTALSATAEEFRTRYSDTSWAKKASVWDVNR